MTLLFMDSFDHYSAANLFKKYNSVSSANKAIEAGRTNNCLHTYGCSFIKTVGTIAVTDYIIIGFGIYFQTVGTNTYIFSLLSPSIYQISIRRNTDSTVSIVHRTAGVVATSVNPCLSQSAWHYMECKIMRGTGTEGEAIIKVDSQEVINANGLNLAYGAEGAYTAVAFSADHNGGNDGYHKSFDDLYICDSTGSNNNDFLGECSIEVLYPDSDVVTEWTPDSGTDNFARVDESLIDDDTSYVEVQSQTAQDIYGLTDTATTVGSVVGVQVNSGVRKTTAGGALYKHQLKQSATVAEGVEKAFFSGSIYAYNSEPFDVDPTDGLDWSFDKVNSLQVGIKRNA